MSQLAWLTDLHLNFLTEPQIITFLDQVNAHPADFVVISGDLTDSTRLEHTLTLFHQHIHKPVYFVCGNHDYYNASIEAIRATIPAWILPFANLTWLTKSGVIELTPNTGLIGHDGWADGRFGDFENSTMMLNDYFLIEELSFIFPEERLEKLHALGDECAAHFAAYLPAALHQYAQVIVVTHVPPFREACVHGDQISDDDALPHFASRAPGEVLCAMAEQYPDRMITVLCGHTHSPCDLMILPNLRVIAGHAVYSEPKIQHPVLELT